MAAEEFAPGGAARVSGKMVVIRQNRGTRSQMAGISMRAIHPWRRAPDYAPRSLIAVSQISPMMEHGKLQSSTAAPC